MINKTDRNDARGIAQMMRMGWFQPVHVKTTESHELRFLLAAPQASSQTAIRDPELHSWIAEGVRIEDRRRHQKDVRSAGARADR
jgi:hypothetical protein